MSADISTLAKSPATDDVNTTLLTVPSALITLLRTFLVPSTARSIMFF